MLKVLRQDESDFEKEISPVYYLPNGSYYSSSFSRSFRRFCRGLVDLLEWRVTKEAIVDHYGRIPARNTNLKMV